MSETPRWWENLRKALQRKGLMGDDKRKVKAAEPPGTKYTGKLCGCGISLAQPGRISMEIQAPIPPSHAQWVFKLFYGAGDQMRVPLNTASRLWQRGICSCGCLLVSPLISWWPPGSFLSFLNLSFLIYEMGLILFVWEMISCSQGWSWTLNLPISTC